MEQWIEQANLYIEPIAGSTAVGEDPRYSDEFSELKAEIEKKSDVNFERIKELSENILKADAKDLRVACYLVLALSRLNGFAGLGQGMTILHQLVDTFGDQLLPAKPKARLSAIRWFQQGKILTFAQAATTTVDFAETNDAIAAYDALFEKLSTLSGEPMSWPDLKKWLTAQQQAVAPKAKEEPKPETTKSQNTPAPISPSVTSAPVASASTSISSNGEYAKAIRNLLAYFKEQGQYAKLVGAACACQWGGLKLPPNEGGKTQLPTPREASLNRIRNAIDNEQWQEGLNASLDAFMEPGGQFLLDISKYIYDCAMNAGEKETAQVIEQHLKMFTARLPKILQLKFQNEDPFASSVVTAWLEQLNENQGANSQGEGVSVASLMSLARDTVSNQSLVDAFQKLDEQPQRNELQNTQIQYCKAQLCVEQDRSDLALPMLLNLETEVERLQLAKLAPDLAMQVWRQLYRLQKDRLASIEQEQSRMETENHISHLQSLMCTTDVASAIQWL